ncbi:MAG: hypothetical protein R6W99_04935 [Clostridia bacterium]
MDSNRTIKVEVPSNKDFSRMMRLTAAGAADACGFNVDMIEDVKVMVSEVFGSIIESGCPGAVISFEPGEGRLVVLFETCNGEPVLKGANEMTVPILEALAGSVDSGENGSLRLVIE